MDFEYEYSEDMVLINRLAEFFPVHSWAWNEGEIIKLDDVSCAIHKNQPEESMPFGDTWKHLCVENKPTEWHIRRIIYFVNHPDEIKDIEIDNTCNQNYICPIPTIVDGNHRFMAAMWLNTQGKMEKVHCRYNGRKDIWEYLAGINNECPTE